VPVLQLFPYPLSAFAFVSASAFAVGIAAFADVRGGGSCRPISKAFQERFGLEGGQWLVDPDYQSNSCRNEGDHCGSDSNTADRSEVMIVVYDIHQCG